jgi:hypothetical protein
MVQGNAAPRTCHEDVCGSGGTSLPLLTLTLDGGECSGAHRGRSYPGERATGTNWIECWVGPRALALALAGNRIPAVQPVVGPSY